MLEDVADGAGARQEKKGHGEPEHKEPQGIVRVLADGLADHLDASPEHHDYQGGPEDIHNPDGEQG